MTPEQQTALTIFITIMSLGGFALWRIPGPCVCDSCPTHVRSRAEEREAARKRNHRAYHAEQHYIKWGDQLCKQCQTGHEDDKRPGL